MVEFILGGMVGGSVTFLISAMFLSARIGKLVFKRGQSVTYRNRLDEYQEAYVVDDAHSNAAYVILSNPKSVLPFLVSIDKVE
jgi:hypothetical protein